MTIGHLARAALLAAVCLGTALAAAAADEPVPATLDVGPGPVIAARPGAAETLDLEACARRALADNDQLQAERFRRRELDGQMKQALATGLPTLDATGTWSRGRDPSFALDSSFGGGGGSTGNALLDSLFGGFSFIPPPEDIPAQTYWRSSLNLSWTLNPIKILGAIGAAGQGIRRQDLALLGVVHQTEQDVVTSYHAVILAAEQLAAVEAELRNQEEFLDISRLRFGLGMATELDTLQAAVAAANLSPQLRQAQQGLRTAGARLNALMGGDPEAPLSIRNEQRVETDGVARETALALAARRPDVQQAEVMSDLLRQSRRVQKSEMRPYLSMLGSYGYIGRRLKDLDNTGHDFWSASVALNVPLFDGLLTRGLVQQTEASLLRNESERAGLQRQARVEVLDLLDGRDAARDNLRAAELNMARAEDLLETSTLMLRHGKADYLTVLQSEAERSRARTNLIQARYDVLTTTASLKRAIGVSPLLPLAAVDGLVAGGSQ
ncbi:MAG: TolC family protein [bacterium]|nr:TolC family protein [bacterium]